MDQKKRTKTIYTRGYTCILPWLPYKNNSSQMAKVKKNIPDMSLS